MDIYWCKTEPPNVGDALNTWLWPKLIPDLDSLDKSGTLFGVGSVLDKRLNTPGPKYILGSGARSGDHGISGRTDLRVFAVRGPLSAEALKINERFGITDPASMVARLYNKGRDSSEIGIVPYFTASRKLWSSIAENLGYRLISPHLGTEDFLSELSRCKFVITEAMHGAILANSLRIPWHPISANSFALEGKTNSFKWTDWTRSLDLPFEPTRLPPLWDTAETIAGHLRSKLKMTFIEHKLRSIMSSNKRYLSDKSTLNKKLDIFQDAIHSFREDASNPARIRISS